MILIWILSISALMFIIPQLSRLCRQYVHNPNNVNCTAPHHTEQRYALRHCMRQAFALPKYNISFFMSWSMPEFFGYFMLKNALWIRLSVQGLKCTYSAYKNIHEKIQIHKIYCKYMRLNAVIVGYTKMHSKYMLHSSILIFIFLCEYLCLKFYK